MRRERASLDVASQDAPLDDKLDKKEFVGREGCEEDVETVAEVPSGAQEDGPDEERLQLGAVQRVAVHLAPVGPHAREDARHHRVVVTGLIFSHADPPHR